MGGLSTRKGTQMDGSGTGLNKTINNTFNNVRNGDWQSIQWVLVLLFYSQATK